MASILDIAELNPVKFYEYGFAPPAKYLSKWMDDFRFCEQVRPWEADVDFKQPWMKADTIYLQFSANYGPLLLELIGEDEGVYLINSPTLKTSAIVSQPLSFYESTLVLTDVPEGIYYWRLKTGSGGSIKYYVSDPQEIANIISNSLLLAYSNTDNDYDVAFDTGIVFNLRIKGHIADFDPQNLSKVYQDQNLNNVRLSSFPSRAFKLIVGDAFGVPDLVADKVNGIFACDTITIDGRGFVRPEGTKMEKRTETDYPMSGWSMDIREATNKNSTRFEIPVDPTRRASISININSGLFGDLAGQASNAEVTLIEVETL